MYMKVMKRRVGGILQSFSYFCPLECPTPRVLTPNLFYLLLHSIQTSPFVCVGTHPPLNRLPSFDRWLTDVSLHVRLLELLGGLSEALVWGPGDFPTLLYPNRSPPNNLRQVPNNLDDESVCDRGTRVLSELPLGDPLAPSTVRSRPTPPLYLTRVTYHLKTGEGVGTRSRRYRFGYWSFVLLSTGDSCCSGSPVRGLRLLHPRRLVHEAESDVSV